VTDQQFQKALATVGGLVHIRNMMKGILKNPKQFQYLLNAIQQSASRTSYNASWVLKETAVVNASLFDAHVVVQLNQSILVHHHEGIVRNLLRIIKQLQLDEKQLEPIAAKCFDLAVDTNQPVAIRVFAADALHPILNAYPELRQELLLQLETNIEVAKPALKVCIKRLKKTGYCISV
jgi:hypothetical protein